jgi:hypothetical protein
MIVYKFFKYLILHLRYRKILNRVYKDENILENLSELFGTEFRIDWLDRIYTVINPNIKNGEYDQSNQFFEYNEQGLINTEYIERYIMEKLNVAQMYIQASNLFDLLTYSIDKLDEYDNYLFVIKPITLDDCLKYSKRFALLLLVLAIVGVLSVTFLI